MPASKHDLADAISRVARGDRDAFEKVYAATCVKLYGIVVRILGRRELPEEVLQWVYIRVWQRAGEYDPSIASPITWLVSIARNRALDEAKRRPIRSLEELSEVEEIPNDDDPLADHERKEERLRLQACLDRLEP